MSTIVNGSIAAALFGKTRRSILGILFGNTDKEFYLRQIIRLTDSGRGAVQRELENLVDSGIIMRRKQGHLVLYSANKHSPVYPELKSFISKALPHIENSNGSISPLYQRLGTSRREFTSFCQRHHIAKLSLFGSVLRPDFRPDSDIDVLVEFKPGHTPGFGIITMENELSDLLGRKVDLRTPGDLSRYFREQVVREASVQYVAK